mgnify:CR=1 FL=1
MEENSSQKVRAWTLRLIEEYRQISYRYRLKLKRPVIAVDDIPGKWGLYDNETRTLTLSRKLIENYPWPMVLEVFKHEICHQIVFEEKKSDELHGPLFREAAKRLALSPWAVRAESELEVPLRDLAETPLTQEEERLSVRVEKLLSLANSSNEHEAAAAMQKVQELYAKYNFDQIAGKTSSPMRYFILNLKKKRVERYQSAIASLLSDHFFVDIIHASLYDQNDCTEYKVLEILGRQENVSMAEYVFHFMENQLKSLWTAYKTEHAAGRRSKTSFYLGVIAGFREKLEESGKAIDEKYEATGFALVKVKDTALKNYVSERYPKLTQVHHSRRFHDSDSYSVGRSRGKELTLRKGIHERKHSQLKLR